MKISFTGTRMGMTNEQKHKFENLITNLSGTTLIHGDCIGADTDAHNIADKMGLINHIRPCTITQCRAHCKGKILAHPKNPLVRNKDIVNDGEILIATPETMEETKRGGTWHTIRYARNNNKPYIIIWPDGTTKSS